MEKAVIYARFSSKAQEDGYSIEAQEAACREYAERNKLEIVKSYIDRAISGREEKTAARIQYQQMLRDTKKHTFTVILIHKYDRVARSLLEQVTLEKRLEKEKIRLVAVAQDFGNTNEAMIARSITWAMAEYYSKNLSSEVRKGYREKAKLGKVNGGTPPFGYDIDKETGKYKINELEAYYVRKMFACALNREGWRELEKEMQAKGIRGKRGAVIKYPQIYDIVQNEKYTGVYLYSEYQEEKRDLRRSKPNAIRVPDAFPAIIDKKTFEEVQKIMKEKKQVGRNRKDYLCSGLLYCSCGAKMYGFTNTIKGIEYQYYKCTGKCGAPLIRMQEADAVAADYLKELLSEEHQEEIAFVLRNYQGHEKDFKDAFMDALNQQIKEKQQEYDNLYQKFTSEAVLPADVIEKIGADLHRLNSEISELKKTEPPEDTSVETIKEWLSSIKEAPDEKAIHLLIRKITATTADGKTNYNIESTLQSILTEIGCVKTQHRFLQKELPLLFFYSRNCTHSIFILFFYNLLSIFSSRH